MQVAMRLGPYWWKRLGEKKIGKKRISKWIAYLILFLGTALVTSIIFYFLEPPSSEEIKSGLSGKHYFLFLAALSIATTTIGTSIATIICLFVVGIAVACALFASLRFKTVFGFSPPVTDEGHKTLETYIKSMLSIRARDLDEVYEREKRILESIKNSVVYHIDNWDRIKNIGISVTSAEHDLGNLEKEKKRAKKGFYSARDAAQNLSLPLPYDKSQLPDSYKEYLPKKAANNFQEEKDQ